MTIPQYDFVTRRKLPPVFPPLLGAGRTPAQFDRSYLGTISVRRRVFRALLSFAAKQLSFWQFSIAIAVFGSIGVAISLRGMPGWSVAVVVSIIVVGIFVMPLRLGRALQQAAESYGLNGETYSATFDDEAIVWQTPAGTYEIPWELVETASFQSEVAILSLKGSRAICVLPNELLTPGAHSRLESMRRR